MTAHIWHYSNVQILKRKKWKHLISTAGVFDSQKSRFNWVFWADLDDLALLLKALHHWWWCCSSYVSERIFGGVSPMPLCCNALMLFTCLNQPFLRCLLADHRQLNKEVCFPISVMTLDKESSQSSGLAHHVSENTDGLKVRSVFRYFICDRIRYWTLSSFFQAESSVAYCRKARKTGFITCLHD